MDRELKPLPDEFARTVHALHRVAEELVAPARKPDNEIALEATPGGFGTPPFEHEGATHRVRVDGVELVHEVDGAEQRAALTSLAAGGRVVAGLVAAELDDAPLELDDAAASALARWYAFADATLRELGGTPVLWPEHFDIAIDLGDEAAGRRATYGFSPGDEHHPEPYAYVGPWAEVSGDLWNARGFRGAELPYRELLAVPAAAVDFFTTRKEAL
jgi:hypothetical protein